MGKLGGYFIGRYSEARTDDLVYRTQFGGEDDAQPRGSDILKAKGHPVEILDGDAMRASLCRDLGFSKADREENVRRLTFVAEMLTRHGVIVLVAAISPYRAGRDEARKRIGRFLEVHVDAPLGVCEGRDVSGVYRRARAGQLSHVSGLDDPYEAPLAAEVVCRSDRETVEESMLKVVEAAQALLGRLPLR